MPTPLPTTHQTVQAQDSLTYSSAARIIEMYMQTVQAALFEGDVGAELITELRACLYAEGLTHGGTQGQMGPEQHWEAIAQAMFTLDAFERVGALPVRRRRAPEGTHHLTLEVGAAQYLLGILPNQTAATRMRERLTQMFGPVPAHRDMFLLST